MTYRAIKQNDDSTSILGSIRDYLSNTKVGKLLTSTFSVGAGVALSASAAQAGVIDKIVDDHYQNTPGIHASALGVGSYDVAAVAAPGSDPDPGKKKKDDDTKKSTFGKVGKSLRYDGLGLLLEGHSLGGSVGVPFYFIGADSGLQIVPKVFSGDNDSFGGTLGYRLTGKNGTIWGYHASGDSEGNLAGGLDFLIDGDASSFWKNVEGRVNVYNGNGISGVDGDVSKYFTLGKESLGFFGVGGESFSTRVGDFSTPSVLAGVQHRIGPNSRLKVIVKYNFDKSISGEEIISFVGFFYGAEDYLDRPFIYTDPSQFADENVNFHPAEEKPAKDKKDDDETEGEVLVVAEEAEAETKDTTTDTIKTLKNPKTPTNPTGGRGGRTGGDDVASR